MSPWSSLPGSRVLIIGSGDPRHLLRTLAPPPYDGDGEDLEEDCTLAPPAVNENREGVTEEMVESKGSSDEHDSVEMIEPQEENRTQSDEKDELKAQKNSTKVEKRQRREILLLEQNMETYCRQLLLHRIVTHPDLEVSEKTDIFIDLFANIRIKPETGRIARSEASQLAKEVAERKRPLSWCWSLELLRQREIDEMERVFARCVIYYYCCCNDGIISINAGLVLVTNVIVKGANFVVLASVAFSNFAIVNI